MPSDSALMEIDGVPVPNSVAPGSASETAEILADANAKGLAVAPVGGGSALTLGNLPERIDVVLSTNRLAGIIDYEPTDLVLSVGAGARLADVQAVLGEHGQRLPIDPPGGVEATIGGLIATARWGPLRYSAGTLRDLLIGISVAHPSGTVSKAGGMVVKNVSGYDMPRLYHGSLGTLGVIVSANFKVLPKPRAEASVVATFPIAAAAYAAARQLHMSQEPLAALDVARIDGAWTLAARIEGREPTVDTLATRVAATVAGDSTRLDGTDSAAWWNAYVGQQQAQDEDAVVVRCGIRPRETAALAEGTIAAMNRLGIGVSYLASSPGLGMVCARLEMGSHGSASMLAEVQGILLGLADTATIVAAPPDWKRGIDVWGRLPEGFEVMQSLRAEFDPARVINPGRFAGFL